MQEKRGKPGNLAMAYDSEGPILNISYILFVPVVNVTHAPPHTSVIIISKRLCQGNAR
jgi:hypothetical protein